MLRHFLLLGFRNFIKYRTSSIVNAIGLSLGISCALFAFTFIDFFYNVDNFHVNGDRIFAINRNLQFENKNEVHGGAPSPLALTLREDLPQVTHASRLDILQAYVRFDQNVFEEQVRFVDPDFFEMFSFPIRSGNQKLLVSPWEIVISHRMAEKYFGDLDPIGKELELKFFVKESEFIERFIISGVAEEFPFNTSFGFNFLVSQEKLNSFAAQSNTQWERMAAASFIQLKAPSNVGEVKTYSDKSLLGRAQKTNEELQSFQFESLLTSSLNSENIRNSVFNGTSIAAFITLSTLSVLLIALACINYMNIAIASASYRLKEIGIRKVMGSNRGSLILQFLSENILVCLLALLLGILWTEAFFLPTFKEISSLPFENNYLENTNLWLFLEGTLFISILGGAGYPAFYISKFQPHTILKGKQKFGSNSMFRKLLLGAQYFFSFVTIMAAIVLIQNNQYQYEIDWGYDQQQVITVKVNGESSFNKLSNLVASNSKVTEIAGSKDQIGRTVGDLSFSVDEKNYQVSHLQVGHNYLSTLNIPIVAGRVFDQSRKSDQNSSILVNSRFKEHMGWSNAIGQTLEIEEKNYNVVGEVSDFHFLPFYSEIKPLIISLSNPNEYRFLTARVSDRDLNSTTEDFKNAWFRLFPNDPFIHYYQHAVFDNSYKDLDVVSKIIGSIATAALFLAAIGLFGLAAIHMRVKIKEVSIRKVLGSTFLQLSILLNKEFIFLVGIASVLAVPASYLAVNALVGSLTKYPVPTSLWPYLLTTTSLLLISIIAISGHVFKTINANPVETLRQE